MVDQIASALASVGIKKGVNVGLFAKNRPEWFQCMIANSCVGARTVALYDTLGDVKHFVKTVVVFDHQEMYGNAHEAVDEKEQGAWGDDNEVKLVGMSAFLKNGEGKKVEDVRAKIEEGDICNIMYTS